MSDKKPQEHLNKNGEWKLCEATVRACRYAATSTHRDVIEQPTSQSEQTDIEAQEQAPQPTSWLIAPETVDYTRKRIEALNGRLERAGSDERFEYTIEEETLVKDGEHHRVARLTLNTPTLKQNGWTFVARVDELHNENADSDFIVSSINNEQVEGNYKIENLKCDHCGQVRHRNKTYIIRNEEGEYKQIGSACLKPFLGLSPQFWAQDPEYLEKSLCKQGAPLIGTHTRVLKTAEVIALALAVSGGGEKYAGANANNPTKYAVTHQLFGKLRHGEEVDPEPYQKQAEEIIATTKFEGGTDYENNMRKLMNQEYVHSRHIGFIISSIPAYLKQTRGEKIREAKPVYKGYLGEEGEKFKNVQARILLKRDLGRDYSHSYYGVDQTLFTAVTDDGKLVKWITSSTDEQMLQANEGNTVNLDRFTVKGHSEYGGNDQTVVNRVKLTITGEK